MKSFVMGFKCHWSVSPRAQLTIPSIGLDSGLAPIRQQDIIWTNADEIRWRIYMRHYGEMSNSFQHTNVTLVC